MESAFRLCNCSEADKVKYATRTLSGGALTWWTTYAGTVRWTATLAIPWETLKTMMAGKYCPRNQVQKFKVEFWELRMKNLEVEEYNNRFLELAALCPSMVTPESKKIEKYIISLPPQIQGNIISAGKETIEATMLMTQNLVMAARRNAKEKQTEVKATDNKKKFEPTQGSGQNSNKKVGDTTKSGYIGTKPLCKCCDRYHHGLCTTECGRCKKIGHSTKNCKVVLPTTNTSPTVPTCYGCGEKGHYKNNCPKNMIATAGSAKGRAFVMTIEEAREEDEVIMGTFLVNNCYATILFDTGADRSYVSTDFCTLFTEKPSTRNAKCLVEVANRKVMKVYKIYKRCDLILADKLFKIDLFPVELGSFDVVVGMNWLRPL
ncbi:uncharacterized protein [Rutidosis leptorrhynchoides]|uniref:uncharacterized protein n=1 Tax=Rutidosis leptorrhynchoides TaxID=125765 RepID=UPI003A994009